MDKIEMPQNLKLRAICSSDFDSNYFELLSQLSVAPKIEREVFESVISNKYIRIFVVEDTFNKKLVASLRLNLEQKLIRGGKNVCHFEDFVVDERYRSLGIGKKLIEFSFVFAEQNDCYKILGICQENFMPYYDKQGFKKTGFVFGKYF